jgi:hypothetical protein
MNLNDDDYDDVSQLRLRFFDVAEEPRRMLPPIQGFEKMPLVPLEKAVKSLAERVQNVENNALIAKQKCRSPPADGLSIDESASIMLYTMEWTPHDRCLYVVLNKTLRSEDRSLLKDWFLYLKLIITALSKIPSTPCRLFRGVKLDLSQEHPKEQKTIWWAFSSCTDSLEILEKSTFLGKTGVRTLFEIDCYSAKDIRKHSRYSKENELVLLPATLFQIVANLNVGHELHIIHLKEIESEFPLIEKGPTANASSAISIKQVKLEPFSGNVPRTKIMQPRAISSSLTDDPTYRNPDLERDISRSQPGSTMKFDEQRLTDRDMRIVVDQAIVDRRCKNLSLKNNEMTSQGISMLANGVRESTTLEELDLSNNRLSDEDLFSLAQVLSVNRSTTVKQWKCCGLAKEKVSD